MVPSNDLRMRNRVRERRLELEMTIAELAESADVSRRVVGLIDRGDKHTPSGTVQLKLARALDIAVQELFWSEPAQAVAS